MAGAVAEGRTQERRRTIRFALAAAVLGAATAIVHVLLINSQSGGTNKPQEAFAATFIGLMAVFALFGAVAAALGSRISQPLLLAAATGNVALGILGVLSIGVPLLLAGMLLFAVKPFADHLSRNLLPPVLVLIILALGTVLTN